MRSRAVLIGVLVAVVLTAAFWFLLYQPARERQAALEAETAQLESQASELEGRLQALRAIREQEVEIRAALARLDELIPSGPAQPATIRQFQLAADAAGVTIQTITFDEPAPVEGATTADATTQLLRIPVTMVVNGGYFQMVDFFRRIEVDVPRAVRISTVALAEAADPGFPVLTTTWNGDLFAVAPVTAETPPVPPPPAVEGEEGTEGAGQETPQAAPPGTPAEGVSG